MLNQIQNTYNGFQQLVTQYQQHGAAVNTSTSPNVHYAYADGSANTTRLTAITYPGAIAGSTPRVVSYNYTYDGLNRRTTKTSSGVLRVYFYSNQWQVLKERVGDNSVDRQFIWGLRYIDDLVLRDRSTERLYALQDANWNVTAVVNTSGAVEERYQYTAYGLPTFLNPDFTVRA